MVYLKRLVLMLQFLTSIPIPFKLDVNSEDFGKGLVFAPLIGLFIGGILCAFSVMMGFLFPPGIMAIAIVILYILLTGGLHLDGLGDTFDGLFSNRSRERMLEIMRDSRVGTNAVLAISSVLLLNVALIKELDSSILLKTIALMPVAGRIGSLVGAGISKYARSGEGLGKSFIEICGFKEILLGGTLYFTIFAAVSGVNGLVAATLPVITALLTTTFFSRKIGGATGDVLGAVCELNQTFFLISAILFYRIGVVI